MELISLAKVYFLNSLGVNKIIKEKDEKKKRTSLFLGITMGIVFLIGCMYSFGYSYIIGTMVQDKSLILGAAIIASTVITLFFIIYLVKGVIVGYSDYEIQSALPIGRKTIIISRVLILYLYALVINAVLIIPSHIVYMMQCGGNIEFYIMGILSFLFIPLAPLVIGITLGLLIQVPLSKLRFGNLIGIFINIIGVLLIMLISLSSNSIDKNLLVFIPKILKDIVYAYPLSKFYSIALDKGDFLSFLTFLSTSIILFILFLYVFERMFQYINSMILTTKTKGNYKIESLEASSVGTALLKRELKKYFSSTMYLFNTSFGVIFMVISAIAILIMGDGKLVEYVGKEGLPMIKSIVPFAMSLFISITSVSSCAISMEGKNLWIMKSMPVEPKDVFKSIIKVNLLMTVPGTIIASVLVIIGLKLDFLMSVFTIVVPLIYCLLIAIVGVVINLHFPKLNWKSEIEVVKQSTATIVAMLIGMLLVAIPSISVFILGFIGESIVIAVNLLVILLLTIVLYRYITNEKCKELYESL